MNPAQQAVQDLIDTPLTSCGDTLLAYYVMQQLAGKIVYVQRINWHAWDGTRWIEDVESSRSLRGVASVVHHIRRVEIGQQTDQQRIKDYKDCVDKAQNLSGLRSALELSKTYANMTATADDMDPDPYLLNTPAGTLDLHTQQIREHDPADRITKLTGCAPGEIPKNSRFLRFMEEILPDPEIRAFVQRVFGMALIGRPTKEVLIIFKGQGANGKTVLLELMQDVFGDYAVTAKNSIILTRGQSDHPTYIMDLLGKRLAVITETGEDDAINESAMKSLTGGERITGRRMGKDLVPFKPSHTLIMGTNYEPKISGGGYAVWRRINVVPFDRMFSEEEQDENLKSDLEIEMPFVLTWCLEGLADYLRVGLNPPEPVRRTTEEYRIESDELQQFIDAEYEITGLEADIVMTQEMFQRWQVVGDPHMFSSNIAFGRKLARKFDGVTGAQKYKHPQTGTSGWRGIRRKNFGGSQQAWSPGMGGL